jgi:hypothetical protein
MDTTAANEANARRAAAADATAVWVFQPFESVPVYHLPSWLVANDHGGWRRTDNGGEEYLVACGRPWAVQGPTGNQRDRAQMMRRDHASMIGRLCLDCARLERADADRP